MFPVDPMDPIGLCSNPSPLKESQNVVYTSGFTSLMTSLPVTPSGLDCPSDLIFRLDSIGLQVLSTGIWLRVLDMCAANGNVKTFNKFTIYVGIFTEPNIMGSG